MKKGLPEVYMNVIKNMYRGASTRVRGLCSETDNFTVMLESMLVRLWVFI